MRFCEKISFNGNNIQQLSKEMSTKLESSYKNSERLIRTEVNFVNNYSAIESFKEQNIEKYQFEAVLDLRTSEICSNMDGKVFLTKEMVVGVNCPPMHPNCRSTIVPYIDGMGQYRKERATRNVQNGKTEMIPGNMTYKEWYKKYVEDKFSKEEIAIMKKKIVNASSDLEIYNRYKANGIDIPKPFDKFQEMKYNDKEEWQNLKDQYELKRHYDVAIKKGELSSLVDFSTYRDVAVQIQRELVGLKTKNLIEIKSYSKHFVDRVCGSIKQKRNGVSIEEIKNTILNSEKFKEHDKSIVIYGDNIQISINPTTGNLIQTNPRIRGKKNDKVNR